MTDRRRSSSVSSERTVRGLSIQSPRLPPTAGVAGDATARPAAVPQLGGGTREAPTTQQIAELLQTPSSFCATIVNSSNRHPSLLQGPLILLSRIQATSSTSPSLQDYYFEYVLLEAIGVGESNIHLTQAAIGRRREIIRLYLKIIQRGRASRLDWDLLLIACQDEITQHEPEDIFWWICVQRFLRGLGSNNPEFELVYWRPGAWRRQNRR